MKPLRRTFEASKFHKGSTERAKLNEDVLTSEYMTSHKYLLRVPFNPPAQPFFNETFRTKREAELWIANHPSGYDKHRQ